MMKSTFRNKSRHFSSTSSTTLLYSSHNEHTAPNHDTLVSNEILIKPSPTKPVPITVQLKPKTAESLAAVKIQATYRSHVVRILIKKIRAVDSEATYWQRMIQRQETVDAVRTSDRERTKINEALMALLLRLDSVPGLDPNVRDMRRHVSRKIVGLQEILDSITDTRAENWDGYLKDWDDMVAGIEKEACKDKGGGYDMEKFCAEHLGLQCLQRFLRDQ